MLKFEIISGSLKITDGANTLLLIAKKDVSTNILNLYLSVPIIELYNLNQGANFIVFSQPLSRCEDSLGVPFTVNSFIVFAEENLGFTDSGTPQNIIVVSDYNALPDPATVAGEFFWCENVVDSYPVGLYYSNGVNYQYDYSPNIKVVANYSALPNPTTVSGEFYWCENSQGTKYLPFSIGGTYYNAGMYYSNGVSWSFMECPYQSTQAQVDAGVNDNTFVTPLTFNNASKWATKQDAFSILPVNKGGTNASSYNNPSGNICPLFYWDGTRFVTDGTVIDLGYDPTTDTFYSGAIKIQNATTQTASFTNIGTKGVSSGAGMQGYSDDGTALSSGNRLAFYALGGAKNASHTTTNASIMEGFATENWSNTATGSNIVFSVTANGTVTRLNSLTIDQDQKLILHGLTASTVPYLDADKKLQSSSVTPTQLSYVDFTSSGQTQLNNRTKIIIKDTDAGTTVTGVTTEVLIGTYPILINTWNSTDSMKIPVFLGEKTGTNGTLTFRVKIGSTDVFSSASLIATYTTANTDLWCMMQRWGFTIRGGFIKGLLATLSRQTDVISTSSAISSIPINTSASIWIFTSYQLTSASDSVVPSNFIVTN